MGASDRGEAEANKGLLEEHECLSQEARVQVAKLELMHVVDWEQAQEAGCRSSCMPQVASPQKGDATT